MLVLIARRSVIEKEGFTKNGSYTNPSPKDLLHGYNKDINGDGKVTITSREVAYNLKREMKDTLLIKHGLSKNDKRGNFWKAVQDEVNRDIERRREIERLKNPKSLLLLTELRHHYGSRLPLRDTLIR